MIFLTTLRAVAILLLTALPGYLFIKKKVISEACIPGFSKVLVFVTQPCLAVYTFKSTEYSLEKLIDVGIFALITVAIHIIMIGAAFLILRKKYKTAIYRVMTFAVGSANCAFFGIPIIESLMPSIAPDVIIFTTVYALVMNLIGWTVGSAIMAQDMKYISIKKILVNPALLGTVVALILFIFEIPLQADLGSMITTAARMATPLSMLIMGMRLGTMRFLPMFTNVRVYATVVAKQILMPLAALLLVIFLPVSVELKSVFFIITACPVASVTLNYAEMVGEGQEEAASMLLVSTMLSILTLPLMMLLLPLLA